MAYHVATASPYPLTTTFTPAASCTKVFFGSFVDEYDGKTTTFLVGAGITSSDSYNSPLLDENCFPTLMGMSYVNQIYYSPGVCPESWTQAARTTADSLPTGAACCPLGYSIGGYHHTFCSSSLTTPYVVYLAGNPDSKTMTFTGNVQPVEVPAIKIEWGNGKSTRAVTLAIPASTSTGAPPSEGIHGLCQWAR